MDCLMGLNSLLLIQNLYPDSYIIGQQLFGMFLVLISYIFILIKKKNSYIFMVC